MFIRIYIEIEHPWFAPEWDDFNVALMAPFFTSVHKAASSKENASKRNAYEGHAKSFERNI